MIDKITENKTFNKQNYSNTKLEFSEYESCIFNYCDFSNSDLSNITFIDCEFNNCNLSMIKLKSTSFKDVRFTECKLLGANFNDCKEFLLAFCFNKCNLNFATFHKLKIKSTKFKNCSLHEADFSETNLQNAKFDNCDLNRAVFENTILEKADFISSYNYSINPESNKIRKAKFSATGIIGLLDKYNIEIY